MVKGAQLFDPIFFCECFLKINENKLRSFLKIKILMEKELKLNMKIASKSLDPLSSFSFCKKVAQNTEAFLNLYNF
jgi:hypothetical protein